MQPTSHLRYPTPFTQCGVRPSINHPQKPIASAGKIVPTPTPNKAQRMFTPLPSPQLPSPYLEKEIKVGNTTFFCTPKPPEQQANPYSQPIEGGDAASRNSASSEHTYATIDPLPAPEDSIYADVASPPAEKERAAPSLPTTENRHQNFISRLLTKLSKNSTATLQPSSLPAGHRFLTVMAAEALRVVPFAQEKAAIVKEIQDEALAHISAAEEAVATLERLLNEIKNIVSAGLSSNEADAWNMTVTLNQTISQEKKKAKEASDMAQQLATEAAAAATSAAAEIEENTTSFAEGKTDKDKIQLIVNKMRGKAQLVTNSAQTIADAVANITNKINEVRALVNQPAEDADDYLVPNARLNEGMRKVV